jgi:hypothetical protein
MLQWLCFSFRPLRIEELAHIFHIGDDIGPPFNPDTVVFHPEDVLDVCPGLLSLTTIGVQWIDEEGVWKYFNPGTMLQIAQLAHFSVKEYLLQPPHRPTWLSLDQELAHLSILKSSMAYFMAVATELRNDMQSTYRTWHEFGTSHSLAIYCGQYTANHLLALPKSQREHPDLLQSFRRLLNPCSGFILPELALFYFNPLAAKGSTFSSEPAAGLSLLLAARLGLTKIVEWLLSFDETVAPKTMISNATSTSVIQVYCFMVVLLWLKLHVAAKLKSLSFFSVIGIVHDWMWIGKPMDAV